MKGQGTERQDMKDKTKIQWITCIFYLFFELNPNQTKPNQTKPKQAEFVDSVSSENVVVVPQVV